MYEDLRGKAGIITGAGRKLGIGQAIARRLAHEGARIIVSDIGRSFEEPPAYQLGTSDYLQSLVDKIRDEGGHAIAVRADVTVSDEVRLMADAAMEEFGRIDILVNNAGAAHGAAYVAKMEEWAWDKTMDVCAKGAFLCSKAVIPHMISGGRGGRIINISSISGKTGYPGTGAYNAAKAALILLTQTLALELGLENITVNAVCPGNVDTLMGRKEAEEIAAHHGISVEAARERMGQEAALGRLARAEDIANVVAFLASEQAGFITGQAINVCGGIEFH
jgi:NAD(P)-dependent dehydrogenase (short-subunit alcohol dehydrogenase family)